jgi:hypothetical protein
VSSIQEAMRKARAEREGKTPGLRSRAGYALSDSSPRGRRGPRAWKVGVALAVLMVGGAALYLRGGVVASGVAELGRRVGLVRGEGPAPKQEGPVLQGDQRGSAPKQGSFSGKVAGVPAPGVQSPSRAGQEDRVARGTRESSQESRTPSLPASRRPQGRRPAEGDLGGEGATSVEARPRVEGPPTVQEARRLRRLGDLRGAETILRAMLERNPTDVEAEVALANLYLQDLREPQKAFPLYQHALALAPERVPVQVNIGVYYIKTGNLNKAEEHLQRALALAPASVEAHYNLACVYALRGERDRAEQALKRASEIDPRCRQWAQEDPDLASLRTSAGPQGVGTTR